MGLLSIGYDPIFIGTILDFTAYFFIQSKNYTTYKGSYFAYSQI